MAVVVIGEKRLLKQGLPPCSKRSCSGVVSCGRRGRFQCDQWLQCTNSLSKVDTEVSGRLKSI
jgi:hypothetical protein